MPKKHNVWIYLFAAALLGGGLIYFTSKKAPPAAPVLPVPASTPVPAFQGTAWGMSVSEVQSAVGSPLGAAALEMQFYTPPNPEKNISRLQAFEAGDIPFLGRMAKVTFVFFESRLFMYRVFFRSNEGDKLNEDIAQYLRGQYGPGFTESDPGFAGKIIWQTKDLLVNYWFYEDELKLREKFTAGYAVIYQPLESLIR